MRSAVIVSLAAFALIAAACSSGSSGAAASATTAEAAGGLAALETAAKAEGALNVIAVPPEWANYKGVLEKFKAKYPEIKVDEQGLDFNSQQEIDAVNNQAGTDKAPDVLDLAPSIALANTALLAPYQVAAWADIPENLKDPTGLWVSDYAGFTSIGCDTKKVALPATVADLLKPEYKGMIALNGNPKAAAAGLHGVVLAALANGGSADDISAGVKFFDDLNAAGNLLPVDPTPATIASGQTPCVIDWEYNNAALTADLATKGIDWKVSVPSDAPPVASYYYQAINKAAPHPAAARLWEEFLYTPEAQNEWLKGFARPVLQDKMVADGTIDTAALGSLAQVAGTPVVLTQAQQTAAGEYVNANWKIDLP